MQLKSIYFFFFLCIYHSNLFSQTYTGKILSADDSLPIVGVKIYNQNKLIYTTKADGVLTVNIDKKENIVCKHVNYISISYIVEDMPSVIYMQPQIQALDQVVLSAGKREQKIGEVTVSIDILKPEKLIENNNTVKLDAAVDNIPGVNIINGQANIRGGSGFSYGAGSRVLMLVDGLPMISADANDIKWDAIPLENIERIEVIKGASSALYGSGALNGIIHLKTAEAPAKPITKLQVFNGIYDSPYNINQKFWSGTRGSNGLSFFHAQKYKSIDFTIGAYYLNDQGYRVTENFINKRVTGSIRYKPTKLKGFDAKISAAFFQSDFGNFLYWRNADSALWPAVGSNSQYHNNRYTLDPRIIYISKKGWKQSLLGRIYITDNNNLTNNGQNAWGKLSYFEYQLQKTFTIKSLKATMIGGAVSNHQKVKSDSIYGQHQSQNYGLYIQSDLKWKNTNVSLGIRKEWNQADTLPVESMPVYRLGISQKVFKATYIRASWGTGYRFPAMAERFTNTSAGAINVMPNSDIKSETGKSWEVGLKQGIKFKKWLGYIDFAKFNTTYSDMIDFTFGYYPPQPGIFNSKYLGFKPINIVNSQINGYEFSLAGTGTIHKITLDILTGFTHINPVYTGLNQDSLAQIENGNILKYRFKNTFKANIDIKYKKIAIGISSRYNSYMLKIDTIFYQVIPGVKEYRETHNKGYTVLDFRIAYQYNDRSKFSFVIKNFLNKEFIFMAGNMGSPRAFTLQYNLNIQ